MYRDIHVRNPKFKCQRAIGNERAFFVVMYVSFTITVPRWRTAWPELTLMHHRIAEGGSGRLENRFTVRVRTLFHARIASGRSH